MKNTKKLCCSLLAASLFFSATAINANVTPLTDYENNAEVSLFSDDTAEPTASGECGKNGSNVTWILAGGVLTISGTGEMADYDWDTIPWYDCRKYIKSVVIGNGVTSIGEYAFDNCSALTSINIPVSFSSIGEDAFHGCSALTNISVDKDNQNYNDIDGVLFNKDNSVLIQYPQGKSNTSYSVPNSVSSIREDAFESCSSLTSVDIPVSVSSIGNYAFLFCSALTNISVDKDNQNYNDIDGVLFNKDNSVLIQYPQGKSNTSYSVPNSVSSIGVYAFCDCSNLTSVDIPDSVSSIGDAAFEACSALTNVDIPDSVTSIGNYAFEACSALTGVNIPNSVSSVGKSAFRDCSALTSINIPVSVSSIGDSAFEACSALTSVNIPNSVTSIGKFAFRDCSALTSVDISDSVSYIGKYAFDGCHENFVINGYTGSYAETYANKNNITFNSIGQSTSTPAPTATPAPIGGECGKYGSNVTWTLADGVLTISGTGEMANYNNQGTALWYDYIYDIKSVIIENGVTSIGDYAFYECRNLTNINIPVSVTSVGESAFEECSALTSINIPNSVTSIGNSAFSYCSALTSVDIPVSVTSIGGFAFSYCKNLTSVDIPDSVTSIGDVAFHSCPALTNISVDKNNQNYNDIDGVLFNKDNSVLIKYPQGKPNTSYSVPDSVTSIEYSAFYACRNLTSVDIPDSVTSVGDDAFSDCSALTSINIPNSVSSIGDYAFSDCENLTNISVDKDNQNYNDIDGVLFNKDDSILIKYPQGKLNTSYSVPNSVTSIKYSAFEDCSALASVNIPNSVTSIGTHAFRSCSALTSVDIPNSVSSIEDYAFYYCSALTSVNIPNSVTSIGTHAFRNCSALTSVDIPVSVTSVGDLAFYYCSALTSVNIPVSVTSIGDLAFSDCHEDLVINGYTGSYAETYANKYDIKFNPIDQSTATPAPTAAPIGGECGKNGSNVTWTLAGDTLTISGTGEMADDSSSDCWYDYTYDIKSVVIGNGVTSIGVSAFSDCENLTSVNIPDSVISIGDAAFMNCENLTSVNIPDSVISIGDAAFMNCKNLTRVNIPDSVSSIGRQTFDGCSALTSIDIPDSVSSIGDFAFIDCGNLTNISVDKNNQNYHDIDGVLFNKDYSILIQYPQGKSNTSYSIPDSVSSINYSAFEDCSALTSIDIPDSVSSIEDYAFYECENLTNISVDKDNQNYHDIDGVLFNKDDSILIKYPQGKSNTSYSVPDSVSSIKYSAFEDCSALTSVDIPDSVSSIGTSAFKGCSALTSISIPDSVSSIGYNAFRNCPDELVINGYTGSYAETYANKNDITFNSIGQPTATPTTEPTAEPTTEPTAQPTTEPTTEPTETPKPIIPAETKAQVCDDFADKITVDFKVGKDGKAELNIETNYPDGSENIQITAYAAYFDSRGRLTGVKILTPDKNGNYLFDVENGNYKIMLWDKFKPIIKALMQ